MSTYLPKHTSNDDLDCHHGEGRHAPYLSPGYDPDELQYHLEQVTARDELCFYEDVLPDSETFCQLVYGAASPTALGQRLLKLTHAAALKQAQRKLQQGHVWSTHSAAHLQGIDTEDTA